MCIEKLNYSQSCLKTHRKILEVDFAKLNSRTRVDGPNPRLENSGTNCMGVYILENYV